MSDLSHFVLPFKDATGTDRLLDGACRAVDCLDAEPSLTPSMRSAIERLRGGLDQYRAEQAAKEAIDKSTPV